MVKLGNFDLSIVVGNLLKLRSKINKLVRPLNVFGSIDVTIHRKFNYENCKKKFFFILHVKLRQKTEKKL